MGVVQAPAGCGKGCGLPVPAYRSCAIAARKAGQSSSKLSTRGLCLQDNGLMGVRAGFQLSSARQGVLCGGAWGLKIPLLDALFRLFPSLQEYRYLVQGNEEEQKV